MIEQTSWYKNQSLYRYIRQQAENKKFFKYLEVGATFSLITIFLITAIAPTASAISKLLGEIKSKEITTKSMKQKITNVVLAQSSYAKVQEKFQVLESSYPSVQDFYKSALSVSAVSDQSNTSIKQLKYSLSGESSKGDNYAYGVNLIVDGSYPDFLNMIRSLNQSRRLIDIESINISRADSGINMSLSSKLFYSPVNK